MSILNVNSSYHCRLITALLNEVTADPGPRPWTRLSESPRYPQSAPDDACHEAMPICHPNHLPRFQNVLGGYTNPLRRSISEPAFSPTTSQIAILAAPKLKDVIPRCKAGKHMQYPKSVSRRRLEPTWYHWCPTGLDALEGVCGSWASCLFESNRTNSGSRTTLRLEVA